MKKLLIALLLLLLPSLSWADTHVYGSGDSEYLEGYTWAIPGAIGATTPNTGVFTTLESTSGLTVGSTLTLGTHSITMTGSLGATGARVTKGWFTDIETTNMPTVNGAAITTILSPVAGSSSIVTVGALSAGSLATGFTPVTVPLGGTGASTLTTAYGLLAAGTTATGTVQTLAAGLTTQILVGGGASALPAWGADLPTAVTIGSAYIYRAAGTDVPVTDGGTGLSAGTEGGIPWFTTTTAMASSALLAANAVMVGGGVDAAPNTITSTATSGYVLTAQGVGTAPIWSGTITGTFGGFTASKAVYSDASGNLVAHATLTDTELGYLDGVTSAIQTQFGDKAPIASPTFTGTVTIPTGAQAGGVGFGGVAQQSPAGTVRLSFADGYAFLWDTGKDFTAYADQAGASANISRYKIVIYDSNSKYVVGYAGVLSAGENLEGELVVNGDMELDSNWTDVGTPSAQARSDVQEHAGTYSRLFTVDAADEGIQSDAFTVVIGGLHKLVVWVYPPSTTVTIKVRAGDNGSWIFSENVTGLTASSWNQITRYYTEMVGGETAYLQVLGGASTSGTWYVDDVSIQQVSDIVSTQGIKLNGLDNSLASNSSVIGGAAAVPAAFLPNGTLTYKIIALF